MPTDVLVFQCQIWLCCEPREAVLATHLIQTILGGGLGRNRFQSQSKIPPPQQQVTHIRVGVYRDHRLMNISSASYSQRKIPSPQQQVSLLEQNTSTITTVARPIVLPRAQPTILRRRRPVGQPLPVPLCCRELSQRSCAEGAQLASRCPFHRAAASLANDLAPKAPSLLAVARPTVLPRAQSTILRRRRPVGQPLVVPPPQQQVSLLEQNTSTITTSYPYQSRRLP